MASLGTPVKSCCALYTALVSSLALRMKMSLSVID